MHIKELSQPEFEYTRSVSLEFARQNLTEWTNFYQGVQQLANRMDITPNIDYFISRKESPDLAMRLNNMNENAIIASDNLVPGVYNQDVASAIEGALDNGKHIDIYVSEVLGEWEESSSPMWNQLFWSRFPFADMLKRNVGREGLKLHLVEGRVPVELTLIDDSLEYWDDVSAFTVHATKTQIPSHVSIADYVRQHLEELQTTQVEKADSIPFVSSLYLFLKIA